MEQVTSVSQLSDIKPTNWAFQALQYERYCLVFLVPSLRLGMPVVGAAASLAGAEPPRAAFSARS